MIDLINCERYIPVHENAILLQLLNKSGIVFHHFQGLNASSCQKWRKGGRKTVAYVYKIAYKSHLIYEKLRNEIQTCTVFLPRPEIRWWSTTYDGPTMNPPKQPKAPSRLPQMKSMSFLCKFISIVLQIITRSYVFWYLWDFGNTSFKRAEIWHVSWEGQKKT